MTRTVLALLAVIAIVQSPALAQFSRAGDRHVPVRVENSTLRIFPVQGNVYMVAGAGPNITIQTSDQSVVVVNTGVATMSSDLLRAIRQLSKHPVRAIINTNAREANTAGNEAISASGAPTTDFRNLTAYLGARAVAAPIIGHENVMMRMSGVREGEVARPVGSVPAETFTKSTKLFNGEGIEAFHVPAATTDGDSFVFFRRSDVISAGDLMSTEHYPTIDLKRGGSINGVIDGLTQIIEMSIFETQAQGGTRIIPGEGRICDQEEVTGYRDMLTIIRDRVQTAIKEGKTLAQVKAARLSRDYDPRYGSSDAFIETVYQSLTQKRAVTASSSR
jgi:glyoxylase-like metal-dependent hydrolase (beta-lactamase superfamily II)